MRSRIAAAASFVTLLALAGTALAQQGRPDPRTREQALSHHRQGWQHLASENWEGAREEFSKAIDLIHQMPTAHYGLGKAYMGLRRYTEAVAAYTACRDLYENLGARVAMDQMARNQQRQDQLREIQDAIQESQRVRPSQASSPSQTRTITELQNHMKQLENSLGSGRNMSAGVAVPAEVHLALGSAYFRADRMSEAEEAYREAVRSRPNFGEAHSNLAVVCLLTGRISEAEEYVRRAERAGFRVNSQLKEDIRAARR